jgi:UDP-2,3-diacylglucosamine pyrophosphatase LpxH
MRRFIAFSNTLRRRNQRVKSLSPEEKAEFLQDFIEWQKILERVGLTRPVDELVDCINDKEELYGLRTNDYKSVLRLDIVIKGHAEFFVALAEWLGAGNRLIIVKGNHDLEWYWLAVRNYLRLDLAERIARQQAANGDVKDILLKIVLPNVTFIDHAIIIDDEFYVEHGHPYDALTRVIGKATVSNGEELNIPFGSFFNRYLLNYVELQYPFLDNVRPTPNMLPLMLRHQFFTGLRLLYDHLSVIIKTVPRSYVGYIFGQHLIGRVLLILLVIIAPPILLLTYQLRYPQTWHLIAFEWLGVLAAIYFVIQALSYTQLKEPDSLAEFAQRRMDENRNYRLVTFGHTHNPDQFEDRGRWFYNTGTWIPIVETNSAEIRSDNTFMFLHLACDPTGKLTPGVLQRWDDVANRAEPMLLIRRAGPS